MIRDILKYNLIMNQLDNKTATISSIKLDILTCEDIYYGSTCVITKRSTTCDTTYSSRNVQNTSVSVSDGNVVDEKMYPLTRPDGCPSCGLRRQSKDKTHECSGHIGRIELTTPIPSPAFIKTIETLLQFLCIECSSLRFSENAMKLRLKDLAPKNKNRIKVLKTYASKYSICTNCGADLPDRIRWNLDRNLKFNGESVKDRNTTTQDISVSEAGDDRNMVFFKAMYSVKKSTTWVEKPLTTTHIRKLLKSIPKSSLELMGIDPKNQMECMIMDFVPVIPSICRISDQHRNANDSITSRYSTIVAKNQDAKTLISENKKFIDMSKTASNRAGKKVPIFKSDLDMGIYGSLEVIMDNSSKTPITRGGEPIRSIKSIVGGKEGCCKIMSN